MRVFAAVVTIPWRRVVSYKVLVRCLQRGSTQVVAQALGRNPVILRVPRDGVIGNDGSLGRCLGGSDGGGRSGEIS